MNKNVETVLAQLRAYYTVDKFSFELNASMFLAGDHKKQLRRDIMLELTGEKKLPWSSCGLHAVSDKIKASFEQLTLF